MRVNVIACTYAHLAHLVGIYPRPQLELSQWNTLPDNIKSAENVITFRRHLKTYLFHIA